MHELVRELMHGAMIKSSGRFVSMCFQWTSDYVHSLRRTDIGVAYEPVAHSPKPYSPLSAQPRDVLSQFYVVDVHSLPGLESGGGEDHMAAEPTALRSFQGLRFKTLAQDLATRWFSAMLWPFEACTHHSRQSEVHTSPAQTEGGPDGRLM